VSLRIKVPAPGQVSGGGGAPLERLVRAILDALREVVALVRRDVLIRGVSLPNATTVTVPHGLGYGYEHVSVSPPTGGSTTGRIQIVAPDDAAKHVRLVATGWGATVTVDLRVT